MASFASTHDPDQSVESSDEMNVHNADPLLGSWLYDVCRTRQAASLPRRRHVCVCVCTPFSSLWLSEAALAAQFSGSRCLEDGEWDPLAHLAPIQPEAPEVAIADACTVVAIWGVSENGVPFLGGPFKGILFWGI